ncbi:hypothetical protein D3C73_888200 [compost metagenome]
MAALSYVFIQTLQSLVGDRIQRRDNNETVLGQPGIARLNEIAFDVHPVQPVIQPAHDVVVVLVIRQLEPLHCAQGFVADHYSNLVLLVQAEQRSAQTCKIPANRNCLVIHRVRLEIMAEQPFPIRLE